MFAMLLRRLVDSGPHPKPKVPLPERSELVESRYLSLSFIAMPTIEMDLRFEDCQGLGTLAFFKNSGKEADLRVPMTLVNCSLA